MDEASFEVRGPDGCVWKVYADGRTEGFPAGSVIFNRIPRYAREEAQRNRTNPTKECTNGR